MKTRKLLAAVLALAMALSLCTAASAEGAIKIGVIGPMTGGAAVYGTAVANGAKIATEEINALGGLQIELDIQDDEHDAEKAINAYNNTMDNGTQMILGTVTTNPCIAVSAQAFEERVFMLTPSASSPKVTEGKDNMYQVCFTDPAQGVASAEMIVEKKLGTKVGIIYNNSDAYSTGIYQAFIVKAKELGLEVVAETTFASDDNADFSVQIAECKNKGADLVFLPIYYTPASLILAQAKAVEYSPVFFGVDGMDGILTLEGFDTSLAEGVTVQSPFSADATDDATVSFVEKYVALAGETPNQFAADGYDCVYALYNALNEAGCTPDMSAEDICEALVATFTGGFSVDGLTGSNMTWSANGEVSKAPNIYVITDGKYVAA